MASPFQPRYPLTPVQKRIEFALVVLILLRVGYCFLTLPASGDEYNLIGFLITKGLSFANGDPARHLVSLLVSDFFMNVFGKGVARMSLLGPLGVIAFLYFFRKVSDYWAPPWVRLVILVTLLFNKAFLAYSISMKPYSLAMAQAMFLIKIVLDAQAGVRKTSAVVWFGLLSFVSAPLHTLSAVFVVSLLGAMIFWIAHNRHKLPTASLIQMKKLLIAGALALVPILPLLRVHTRWIRERNSLLPPPDYFHASNVPKEIFGWYGSQWNYVLLGLITLAAATSLRARDRRTDFLPMLIASVTLVISAAFLILQINFFAGRFVLWLGPLLLIWIGRQIDRQQGLGRAGLIGAMLICFVLAPIRGTWSSYLWTPYVTAEKFARHLVARFGKSEAACFRVVGGFLFADSIRALEFFNPDRDPSQCSAHYLVNLFDPEKFLQLRADPRHELVEANEEGDAIFLVRNDS